MARLYPEIFAAMEACYVRHSDFIDATVKTFDREVQFYLAYFDFARQFKDVGLPFCYPDVAEHSKQTNVEDAFDMLHPHPSKQRLLSYYGPVRRQALQRY